MTEPAFLRDICEHPRDDAPRLIFADWLEDNGQPERAEFIRAGVEVARAGPRPACELTGAASLRERELLLTHWAEWAPRRGPDSTFEVILSPSIWTFAGTPAVAFRRGFVHSITLPIAAFLRHAKALFAAHPIEEVRLSDREPSPHASPKHYCWRTDQHSPFPADDPYVLPDAIHRLIVAPCGLAGYWKYSPGRDKAAAHAALSRACVAWGRKQAGLPPLEG